VRIRVHVADAHAERAGEVGEELVAGEGHREIER
jgi:hypothetical protein